MGVLNSLFGFVDERHPQVYRINCYQTYYWALSEDSSIKAKPYIIPCNGKGGHARRDQYHTPGQDFQESLPSSWGCPHPSTQSYEFLSQFLSQKHKRRLTSKFLESTIYQKTLEFHMHPTLTCLYPLSKTLALCSIQSLVTHSPTLSFFDLDLQPRL